MAKNNQPDLDAWKQERDEAQEQHDELMREYGLNPIHKFVIGETVLHVCLDEAPREVDTQHGLRKSITVEIDGETKNLFYKPTNRTYRAILGFASQGISDLTIVRTGEGSETRYDIKPVKVEA